MFLIIISIVSIFFSWLITWYITRHFHTKSVEAYENEIKNLTMELKNCYPDNKIAIKEDRIEKASESYRRGTIHLVNYLKSLKISDDDKADIYDATLLRKKGRPGKNNPFK